MVVTIEGSHITYSLLENENIPRKRKIVVPCCCKETLRMLLVQSLSVRPVHFRPILHILPCIKLYSKMAAQVFVYGCGFDDITELASIAIHLQLSYELFRVHSEEEILC